jgi:hypothetical protein
MRTTQNKYLMRNQMKMGFRKAFKETGRLIINLESKPDPDA